MKHTLGLLTIVVLCLGQTCDRSTSDSSGPPSGTPADTSTGDGGASSTDGTNSGNGGDSTPGGTDSGSGNTPAAIVADHQAASAFDSIPAATIAAIQARFRIFYGHTSHGSQIITGIGMIQAADARFAFNAASGTITIQETEGDLGTEGDTNWVTTTREQLNQAGNTINLVIWSWCGGVSDNTPAGIDAYLQAMSQLERDYPNVVFVYMTGHLDGTGPDGNLAARNRQIRDYCRTNHKVLFDFADIESYDPANNYYPTDSDACEWCTAWCDTHSCPTCGECAHSHCFNCYRKGQAFWWLLGRITGWSGG